MKANISLENRCAPTWHSPVDFFLFASGAYQ
jgi:hypothetical protein